MFYLYSSVILTGRLKESFWLMLEKHTRIVLEEQVCSNMSDVTILYVGLIILLMNSHLINMRTPFPD